MCGDKPLEKFDVVVVGAGTGGCLAAKTMAEAGLNVCLVERKKREEVGEKVCGDALGEHHLKALGLEKPQGGELEKRIEGVRIFSPDFGTVFTIRDKDFVGYILNRRLFGQWLLELALDEGVVFRDHMQCLEPIVEKGFVSGVSAKNMATRESVKLKSKVVVDASGFVGVVRQKLPEEFGIDREVANEDVEACYREIRQLRQESGEAEFCEIYLDQKATPGGYSWIFPKGGARVNVGLGICMRGRFPNPKGQFYKHVLSRGVFEGSLLLSAGAWYDPTRRPLDNMVGNGIVVVGDAACSVNPIHGGGIGPSMLCGSSAGKTIVDALENGEASQEALWSHNSRYMEVYGAKQARLDIFRYLLIGSSDEELSFGMSHKLLTEGDVLRASLGEDFRLNVTEATKRVSRGLRRVGFLKRLRLTVKLMNRVKAHYKDYPETAKGFGKWRAETERLFSEARSEIIK